MYNTYFTIGSIVMLRGEGKKVMVIGYYGISPTGRQTDYMGVVFPEGYQSADSIIGFNQNEVIQVLHEGYKDIEQERFFDELRAFSSGMTYQSQPTVPFTNSPTTSVGQTSGLGTQNAQPQVQQSTEMPKTVNQTEQSNDFDVFE